MTNKLCPRPTQDRLYNTFVVKVVKNSIFFLEIQLKFFCAIYIGIHILNDELISYQCSNLYFGSSFATTKAIGVVKNLPFIHNHQYFVAI